MFLIIGGHPATGKTTLTEKLKELYPDHTIFHTDDYIQHGYKESLYVLLEDIKVRLTGGAPYNIIVEGVMGSRLMRKLQEQSFDEYVDMYLYIKGKFSHITDIYARERPDKDLSKIESTMKGLDTVHNSIITSDKKFAFIEVEIGEFLDQDTIPDIIKTTLTIM